LRFGEGFFAQGCAGLLRLGGADGVVFFLDAGDGVEEELGEVADGEGVAAVDALASKHFGDVGEERVDAVGGVEIAGGLEEFGGEDFRIGLGGDVLLEVMGAERVVSGSDEHAATTAGGVDVRALIRDLVDAFDGAEDFDCEGHGW